MVYGIVQNAKLNLQARPIHQCELIKMEYICATCNKTVTSEDIKKRIRCPYCGSRLLFKKRPKIVKEVKSR